MRFVGKTCNELKTWHGDESASGAEKKTTKTHRRVRTALFHLQFCKNLTQSYGGTLQKEIYHQTKI